jgi:hypothetical protein
VKNFDGNMPLGRSKTMDGKWESQRGESGNPKPTSGPNAAAYEFSIKAKHGLARWDSSQPKSPVALDLSSGLEAGLPSRHPVNENMASRSIMLAMVVGLRASVTWPWNEMGNQPPKKCLAHGSQSKVPVVSII